MAKKSGPIKRELSALEKKLNFLESVMNDVKKEMAHFKRGKLKDQTMDFIELMGVFKDAIATYRDEVADQIDRE